MKKLLFIIGIILFITGCSLFRSDIEGDTVNVDTKTFEYTFKDNGKKVTGTVVFYEINPTDGKKIRKSKREVVDGKRVKVGYDYYPNGTIAVEYPYDENGLVSGVVKMYYDNGKLYQTSEAKENLQDGIMKEFRENGTQSKETIFESGKKIREYDFDGNGTKIIPAIDRLELITFKTGYYEYVDYNRNEILYQPMVIMKWKNISDSPITEKIEIEGIFIDNSKEEEMSKTSDYFQGYSDPPLQPNLSRQGVLQSSVGYTHPSGIYKADISCQIIINKQLYKTIRIDNEFLSSNRIQ